MAAFLIIHVSRSGAQVRQATTPDQQFALADGASSAESGNDRNREGTLDVTHGTCLSPRVIPVDSNFISYSDSDSLDVPDTEDPGSCPGAPRRDVFYEFTPIFSGDYEFLLCGGDPPSNPLQFQIDQGCCPGGSQYASACFPPEEIPVVLALTGGLTYTIEVGSQQDGDQFVYSFSITRVFPVPANDDCAGAILVGVPSQTPGNTLGATDDVVPNCGEVTSPVLNGVWYRVVGSNDTLIASTCNEVTDFDTKLAVYRGPCTSLTCRDGDDDDPACTYSGNLSTVKWFGIDGASYYILVGGTGPLATNFFRLDISVVLPPPCCAQNPEAEPNDSCHTANPIPLSGNIGCVAGTIADSLDVDVFTVEVAVPSRIIATAHADSDTAYCAHDGGLNSLVALYYSPPAEGCIPIHIAVDGGEGTDPRLETSYCLDPGTYRIVVSRDRGLPTTGPYVLTIELVSVPPVTPETPTELTIIKKDTVLVLNWVPSILATEYRVETAAMVDGPWSTVGMTDGAAYAIRTQDAGLLGFYRVVALAPPDRCNTVQDLVGTHYYTSIDTADEYPCRIDSLMLAESADGHVEVCYLVATFVSGTPPGLNPVQRVDVRWSALRNGGRNLTQLDGARFFIDDQEKDIVFARVGQAGISPRQFSPLVYRSHTADTVLIRFAGLVVDSGDCVDRKHVVCRNSQDLIAKPCPLEAPPAPESCEFASCRSNAGGDCHCFDAIEGICEFLWHEWQSDDRPCKLVFWVDTCERHVFCPPEATCLADYTDPELPPLPPGEMVDVVVEFIGCGCYY